MAFFLAFLLVDGLLKKGWGAKEGFQAADVQQQQIPPATPVLDEDFKQSMCNLSVLTGDMKLLGEKVIGSSLTPLKEEDEDKLRQIKAELGCKEGGIKSFIDMDSLKQMLTDPSMLESLPNLKEIMEKLKAHTKEYEAFTAKLQKITVSSGGDVAARPAVK